MTSGESPLLPVLRPTTNRRAIRRHRPPVAWQRSCRSRCGLSLPSGGAPNISQNSASHPKPPPSLSIAVSHGTPGGTSCLNCSVSRLVKTVSQAVCAGCPPVKAKRFLEWSNGGRIFWRAVLTCRRRTQDASLICVLVAS